MDKIKISSLGILPENESRHITIGDTTVEVKRRIPYEEMLDLVQFCIDYTINDRPFISAPLKQLIKDFGILRFYTNFDTSFLETYEEMKDVYSEYDVIRAFDVMNKVIDLIDAEQIAFFNRTLEETLTSISLYRNSAQGIVDALSDAAKDVNQNMDEAMKLLGDSKQMENINSLLAFAQNLK